VWVPHLSERIHSISAKTKSNIHLIVRKVLLMARVEMFPLPTISRMSDLSIPLGLDMTKQELSFKQSMIGRYLIIRAGTFLSLDP
jgi:hypothetical protein